MSVEPDNLRDGHKGNPPWKKLWDRCYQLYLRLYVFTNKEPVLTIRRALWCEHTHMACAACMHAAVHDWQVSDEGTLMRLLLHPWRQLRFTSSGCQPALQDLHHWLGACDWLPFRCRRHGHKWVPATWTVLSMPCWP